MKKIELKRAYDKFGTRQFLMSITFTRELPIKIVDLINRKLFIQNWVDRNLR